MSSVVSICNLALSNIGKNTINALTEASAEARACNQFYEHTRDLLLQAYPWRFAGKTLSMAELENDKPGAWLHAYSRPTDCLKVRWIRPQYTADPSNIPCGDVSGNRHHHRHDDNEEISIPYEIEATTLYCNLSPALLRYTFRLTDPTRFSPLFTDALSWNLAARLAMPLTRDQGIRTQAYQLAQVSQATAAQADANEVRENSDHESDTVRARHHG
jgi:hypothetical protein